jgi:O-antigen ligase
VVLTLTLLLATLLASAALATALIPARVAVWLGCALNVVQLHTMSIFGIYPSLALLSWLTPWRSVFGSPLWRFKWMQAALALALVQAVSLSWSPDLLLGVRQLVYWLPLPFAAHAFYRVTRDDPNFARRCLRLLLLSSALEAAFVIVFRALPSVEAAFLNGPAALFSSANTLSDLLYGKGNNVLDPGKSGGLFTNANLASAYLGMCAIAAWYVGGSMRSSALRAVAVLDWVAVLFAGSKAGLLLAATLPLGLAALSTIRARRANPVTLFAASVGLAIGTLVLALPIVRDALEEYARNALFTLGSREELWRYATEIVEQNALTGLGFGGWEQRFALYSAMTGVAAMPPHNSLFIVWLQSGLAGLVAGVAFVGAVFAALARMLQAVRPELERLSMAVAGAFSWYFLQGLGENFGLIGEVHMTPLIAVLLGHLCARYDALTEPYEHSTEPLRGAAAPSAVPAV